MKTRKVDQAYGGAFLEKGLIRCSHVASVISFCIFFAKERNAKGVRRENSALRNTKRERGRMTGGPVPKKTRRVYTSTGTRQAGWAGADA